MSSTHIPFVRKGARLMIDITAEPNSDFSLSPADRQFPGGQWLHSFLGTIVFTSDDMVIREDNVPIIFLISSIIESTILVSKFGLRSRIIPVPSVEREIKISRGDVSTVFEVVTNETKPSLVSAIHDESLVILFRTIATFMKQWKPDYLDDKHFIRSNWIVSAALDMDVSATIS